MVAVRALVGGARELHPAAEVRLAVGRDRLEQRLDAPAMRVAADHDVVDAEVADAILDRRTDRIVGGVGRWHHVGDIANLEQLARVGAGDLCGNDAAVGASDPEEARLLLLLRQALVEGAVALELLAKTLVPLDRVLDVEVDAPLILLLGHGLPLV